MLKMSFHELALFPFRVLTLSLTNPLRPDWTPQSSRISKSRHFFDMKLKLLSHFKTWRSFFYTEKRRSSKISKANIEQKQQFGWCLLSVFVLFNDSRLIQVTFLTVCVHQQTTGSDSMLLLISYTALRRLEEEKGESKGVSLELLEGPR